MKNKKSIFFWLTAAVTILLFISVFFLMNRVQFLLNSDVENNLTEIVTQNKDVITSRLKLELNNIELMAKQISEEYSALAEPSKDSMEEIFLKYAEEKQDNSLFVAFTDGTAIFPGGHVVDISGRNYFRRSMEGKANISERTISRIDGEDIFVISVPILNHDNVVGTVQKQYTPKEMYDICSVSLFSEQGYMYIINSEGYILISSDQEGYSNESDNYFRMIYAENHEESKRLQTDIENDRANFMEMNIGGQKIFSAYTPIGEIYDWYLISSVPTNVVSPNANIVIKMFYVILFAVVLFFTCIMMYFFYLKNKQQNHLKRIAFVDTVTNGNTFVKFEQELKQILKEHPNDSYYIFSFDIDNFKYINSYYGFDQGDRILKIIYDIYSGKMNPGELLARVTGDHFAALISDASQERLNKLFESELGIEGIKVYFSAGLYPVAGTDESVSLMVDKANLAKQKIKGMRYKRVETYSKEDDKKMNDNEQTKRAIEYALTNDEIIPFFQPKVNINTGELVGAEALARWQADDGRIIQPCDFIPVCEQTGLIIKLDMTIFEKTLKFLNKNLKEGVRCVPISVNFSRMHTLDMEFLQKLLDKMKEYKVPAELIELELTETVILDNFDHIQNFLMELHKNGLKMSMDDFGSGYSSLHMLKDVDIDVLKIDREFLRQTVNSKKQKTIFESIVDLAKKLEIKIVVEGVENRENVEMMRECGCFTAQGYFYSKPVDWIEFEKFYCEGKVL